jgi:hypothetical protein
MTARDDWEAAYAAAPLRDTDFETMSGIPLEPVHATADGLFPGQFPYTRGPHASMYRSRLWTMRMFAGFGTAEDTNARFKEILRSGGDGLSTAFDLPTLMGRDSDDPLSLGEVGKAGVAVDSLADVEDLFADIDLGAVTTSMTINSPAAILLAMYVAVAERGGTPRARLGGTLQNDILKEYQAQKEYIFPPRPSMRLVTDVGALHDRRDAALAPGLGVRLPHQGGGLDRRTGARVHAGQRLRVRRGGGGERAGGRRLRPPAQLLLQRPHRLLRGDRQVPRRPQDLGPLAARPLRRHP